MKWGLLLPSSIFLMGIAGVLRAQMPPPGEVDRIVEDVQETVSASSWNVQQDPASHQGEALEIFTYPDILECGLELENLAVPAGARIVIPMEVGEDLIRMTLQMFGGEGDADMYLSQGEVPGLHSYQYRPYVNGNVENIDISHPDAGRWFLMIHAYRAFNGVSISMDCVVSQDETVATDFELQQDLELALYYELTANQNTNDVRNLTFQSQVLNQQGRQAYTAGRYNEALEIWTQWMELDPDNPRPVALVGDLYLRAEDLEQAISYYRKSLDLQPGQIGLMSRLARIIDQEAGDPEEAKKLINRYARLFPASSGVALAQAEWLIRRNRYEEAVEVISRVIEEDPENLNSMSLIHPLLRTEQARYANMLHMLRIGQLPGREMSLGFAIRDNDLLTQPESWVFMDFIYRMSGEAPSQEQRQIFLNLLPRDDITVEDFRIGRMSSNWISSREEVWGEDGSMILSADPTQTEAFLRLKRSDAMHSGFVEAQVDDSRGFFWIYARRGQGNMIRYGFADDGQLYLQVWMNDHLVHNQTRVWSRSPGNAMLRLELRGDGAMGYLNGDPAFNSPVSIPNDMGLGWWGIAPWSAQYGTASVTVSQISGGPLPVRLGLIPKQELNDFKSSSNNPGLFDTLNKIAVNLSTLAPEWYVQDERGGVRKSLSGEGQELRLMARYYRLRLLPLLRVRSYRALDLKEVADTALRDRVDGFTLLVDRMPEPEWLDMAENMVTDSGITLHIVLLDRRTGKASFRELCATVGIFSGPRRVKTLPLVYTSPGVDTVFSEYGDDRILFFSKPPVIP